MSPERIKAEVMEWIAGPARDPWPLARRLFDWQVATVPKYAALAAGAHPERLEEIPAIPVGLFRDHRFDRAGVYVFRTSGTTAGRRGEHWLSDLDVADLAIRRHFAAMLPHAPARCVSICPNAEDSSLGHMIRLLYPEATLAFPDIARALDHLDGPVFLASTAFALDELLGLGPDLSQALVMVTGGFKGRQRTVSEEELARRVPRMVREYGMTELSSQLWDVDGRGYLPPWWLYPYTVDPVSGEPAEGEGQLRFVDLANWDGALAIETQDLGRVVDGRVILYGRLEGAPARGCSLAAEETLGTR